VASGTGTTPAPDRFMTHLSMSEGDAEWGEHVGDSEYRGKGRSIAGPTGLRRHPELRGPLGRGRIGSGCLAPPGMWDAKIAGLGAHGVIRPNRPAH
jgi:hypothetical protein